MDFCMLSKRDNVGIWQCARHNWEIIFILATDTKANYQLVPFHAKQELTLSVQ